MFITLTQRFERLERENGEVLLPVAHSHQPGLASWCEACSCSPSSSLTALGQVLEEDVTQDREEALVLRAHRTRTRARAVLARQGGLGVCVVFFLNAYLLRERRHLAPAKDTEAKTRFRR